MGLGERETAKDKAGGQFWKKMVLKCTFLVQYFGSYRPSRSMEYTAHCQKKRHNMKDS